MKGPFLAYGLLRCGRQFSVLGFETDSDWMVVKGRIFILRVLEKVSIFENRYGIEMKSL